METESKTHGEQLPEGQNGDGYEMELRNGQIVPEESDESFLETGLIAPGLILEKDNPAHLAEGDPAIPPLFNEPGHSATREFLERFEDATSNRP